MRSNSNDNLFDKRLIERHLKAGLVTQEEVDKFIGKLEDATENSEYMSVADLVDESQK